MDAKTTYKAALDRAMTVADREQDVLQRWLDEQSDRFLLTETARCIARYLAAEARVARVIYLEQLRCGF
jgi:chorismate mutase